MPCNQFGGQEPGTALEVESFARARGCNFPVFEKLEVNGPGTHPLYAFLKDEAPSDGFLKSTMNKVLGKNIKWNFAKFLVRGSDGKVVSSYEPTTGPLSIEGDIKALLA